MEKKTVLITQARLGSRRLQGKILKEINGKTLLQIHLDRLRKCKCVNEIIVATTNKNEDLKVYELVTEWGFSAYQGSEIDVLDRFYKAVLNKNAEWIVRVTSDCPLIDSELVDKVIQMVQESGKDYGTNTLVEHFPDGQDIEVFRFSALKNAWENATLRSEREHVTPYIRKNTDFNGGTLFSALNYPCDKDYSSIRMTVDEEKDLELITHLVNDLDIDKTWLEYTRYIIDKGLYKINNSITRNEGLLESEKNDN